MGKIFSDASKLQDEYDWQLLITKKIISDLTNLIAKHLVIGKVNFKPTLEHIDNITLNLGIAMHEINPSFTINNYEEDWVCLQIGHNHRIYYLHWSKQDGKNHYEFTTQDGNLSVSCFQDKMDVFPVLVKILTALVDMYDKAVEFGKNIKL